MDVPAQEFLLQPPLVAETIIRPVADNHVVQHADVHHLGGLLHLLCQTDVVRAGLGVAGRMVVHQGQLRGACQESFAENGAHIGRGLVQAATADTHLVDGAAGGIEQQYPELLVGQVA